MTRRLVDEHIVKVLPDGRRVLYIVPAIPDDAPDPIREALARRRLATMTGACPCGETGPHLTRQQRRALQRRNAKRHVRAVFEHEPDCPAGDQILLPMLRAWIAGDETLERAA